MNVRLIWIGDPLACEIRVSTDEFVIGRDRTCHLRIDHPEISPRHCRIVTIQQRIWLEDLATSCLLEGNDRLLRAGEVKHDDRIRIGPARFTVVIEADLAEAEASPG